MSKEIELQIMDRGDISIEKVSEHFLVEWSKIENREGSYTVDDYIPTPKNIPAEFLHCFNQNEHYNYNEKEEERDSKRRWFLTKGEEMGKIKEKWLENFTS